MMYVLRYALCGDRGLYDVTVTCRTGGIMIIMMLVAYCFFCCAICVYFRLWVCNTVIGTMPVDGWTVTSSTASRGLSGVVKVLR